MRTSFLLCTLAIALGVSAEADDFLDRQWIWFTNATPCNAGGCKFEKCGSGQCETALECGNWGGVPNSCCKIAKTKDSVDYSCLPYKEQLEALDLGSGNAAIKLENDGECDANSNPVYHSLVGGDAQYCCPSGQDAVVVAKYDQYAEFVDEESFHCIPALEVSSSPDPEESATPSSSDSPSSSTPSSSASRSPGASSTQGSSPSPTESSSSSSQTPNSAGRIQNALIAAPAIVMMAAVL